MKRGTGITVMRIRRYLVVCGGAPTSGLRNLGNRLYAFAHERFRNEEVGLFWMKRNEREERGENKDTYIYIYISTGGEKEKGRERRKESLMERERGSSTHREVEVDDLSTLLSLHRRMATNGLRCHDRSRQQLVPRSDYPRLGFHLGRYTFHRLLLFPLRSVYQTITARITWSNTVISFRASARRTALLETGYI